MRRRTTSSSTKPSTLASSASTRSSRSTSNMSSTLGASYRHFPRIREAVAHMTSKRSLMTAPWKKTRSTSIAKVVGYIYPLRAETPFAILEQIPQTKWQITPSKENLDLQNEGLFEEDGKTSLRAHGQCRRHKMLCLWCEAAILVSRILVASTKIRYKKALLTSKLLRSSRDDL